MRLFLSPHNDDETLFGAYTLMRERPTVCVVYDSHVQPSRGVPGCGVEARRIETERAIRVLTGDPDIEDVEVPVDFLGLHDSVEYPVKLLADLLYEKYKGATEVYSPLYEHGGHDQHNLVAQAAALAFPRTPGQLYLTYTRNGGKSRNGTEVLPRSGDDIARKLRALACYSSQLQIDPRLGCWPHFVGDLREYVL